jgi:hypothetical protein
MTIPAVASSDLAAAAEEGQSDSSTAQLVAAEQPFIKLRRAEDAAVDWEFEHNFEISARPEYGMGLSGGGIRSATFSLGVLQALAHHGKLDRIDYLSTVSGGGYIGSALTWYLAQEEAEYGLGSETFPFGAGDPNDAPPAKQADPLKYLRQRGNYLSPGDGITVVSGIVVLLRGMVVNLCVWVPLIVLFMVVMLQLPQWLKGDNFAPKDDRYLSFDYLMLGGAILLAAFVIASKLYSLSTLLTGELKGILGDQKNRYKLRRLFEDWLRWPLMVMVAMLFVGLFPDIDRLIEDTIAGTASGPAAAIVGALGGLWSYFKTSKGDGGGIPLSIMTPIAAFLFIVGILASAYMLAHWLVLKQDTIVIWKLRGPELVYIAAAGSMFLGWLVNINYMSLHRYYRDRLMEAFMPDLSFVKQRLASEGDSLTRPPASKSNSAKVHELYDFAEPNGPFHIVNTNLVLIGSDDRVREIRGGDNFIFSPLYSGSNATGWKKTEAYLGGDMTLSTAMAISGAAADPHTGVGGVGPTRNRFVSLIMALLDIRLGYWLRSPADTGTGRICPNHFHPGLAELLGLRYTENDKFLHLSDGGHFENLGLYELIRRRLGVIVICDGGAVPSTLFPICRLPCTGPKRISAHGLNSTAMASPSKISYLKGRCFFPRGAWLPNTASRWGRSPIRTKQRVS